MNEGGNPEVKKLVALIVSTAVVITLFIASTSVVHASYGAPEGWRNLPDYYVFKDTYRGGWSGSSGGLETNNGNLPVDTEVMFDNLPSLKVNVTSKIDWMTSILVMNEWANHDIHNYVPNGYLEFNVKGKVGGEQFKIGGDDHVERRASGVEHKVLKSVSDYVTVSTEWQHVKIPLKDIYNDPTVDLDENNAKALLLDRVNDQPFTVWINQLKLTTPDKEPAYPAIKVNQVGFRNATEKYAYVSGFEDEFTADVGTPFQVRRASDDSVAYSGQLVLVKNYDIDSGERVLKAVFTDLQESGEYYITVDAEGIEKSLQFKIGEDVFEPLLVDATRYYYYQRSGTDLEPQYAPDFYRADITPQDVAAVFESDPTKVKDVSKGWFDAGDKGKWTVAGASAVDVLLWSYHMFPESYADNQLNIPESGNGVPDVLDEARWEIEWILKMQEPETGGFYGRVQSFPNDGQINSRIINDIYNGVTNVKPTNDTAMSAAALAHASLVYAPYDPVFAAECLEAAKRAWVYLEQNPNNIKGPGYTSDDDKQSRLVAAAALYRVTGESKYHDYFLNNYTGFPHRFEDPRGDWVGTGHFAFFHYLQSGNPDQAAVQWYKEKFTIWLNKSIGRYQNNAWNHTLLDGNYYWGSNNMILGSANEALIGSKLLGMNNETVNNLTLSALNYLLGANPMRKSYVTGHGEDSLQTVYAILNKDFRPGVIKGVMPLGPNRWNNPGISIFPGKNFMDCATEWTMNEHAVGSAANLVFITAFANSDKAAPVTTATINPSEPNGSGWYTSDVTVSLTVYDNLSGVAKTEYSMDGGTVWHTYTAPVTFSQDGTYSVSYRSMDKSGNVEVAKTIGFKLDSTGPEITVTGVENGGTFNDSLDVTPVITLNDSLSGVDAGKTTVTLDGKGLQQGTAIPLYTLPLGSHTLIVTASDLAGNTSSQEIVFQTTASIESMQALVNIFTNAGWIDNEGIVNSLHSKLSSESLAALVNEVKAQSGKHISVEAADCLLRDAQYLLFH
jgi:endoglucanase